MTTRVRTARRPGAILGGSPARRRTAWDDELIGTTVANAGQQVNLIAQNVSDPEKRGCTIIRVIYHMWFLPNSPGAVNGVEQITLGIGIASDDAFSAGAIPEADTAADFPMSGWMYRDRLLVVDSIDAKDSPAVELYRDLRVSRKMERGSVYVTHESDGFVGSAFTVAFSGIIRVLYKLP